MPWRQIISEYHSLFEAIGVTVFGGLARYVRSTQRFHFCGFLKSMIASSFAAIICGYLIFPTELMHEYEMALVGMAAYGGSRTLDFIEKKIKLRVKGDL